MNAENQRIKQIRNHYNLSQAEFAERLGIKQGSYSDIERGKIGISGEVLKNLITKFNVNALWLYGESEGPKLNGLPPALTAVDTLLNNMPEKADETAKTVGFFPMHHYIEQQITWKENIISSILINLTYQMRQLLKDSFDVPFDRRAFKLESQLAEKPGKFFIRNGRRYSETLDLKGKLEYSNELDDFIRYLLNNFYNMFKAVVNSEFKGPSLKSYFEEISSED